MFSPDKGDILEKLQSNQKSKQISQFNIKLKSNLKTIIMANFSENQKNSLNLDNIHRNKVKKKQQCRTCLYMFSPDKKIVVKSKKQQISQFNIKLKSNLKTI